MLNELPKQENRKINYDGKITLATPKILRGKQKLQGNSNPSIFYIRMTISQSSYTKEIDIQNRAIKIHEVND